MPPTTSRRTQPPNRSDRSGQNRPPWLSAPDKEVDALQAGQFRRHPASADSELPPPKQPDDTVSVARRRRQTGPGFATPRLRKSTSKPPPSTATGLIPLNKSTRRELAKPSFQLAKNVIFQCFRLFRIEVGGWRRVVSSCISRLTAGEQNETANHRRRTLIRQQTVPVRTFRCGP